MCVIGIGRCLDFRPFIVRDERSFFEFLGLGAWERKKCIYALRTGRAGAGKKEIKSVCPAKDEGWGMEEEN